MEYDLTGQRFGRLLVLGRIASASKHSCWLTRCDCGEEKTLTRPALKYKGKNEKSCGCSSPMNLEGKRFGKLLILCPDGRAKDGSILWKARCDCGKEITTRGYCLVRQSTKSCGCFRKDICSKLSSTHRVRLGRGIAARNAAFKHYMHSAIRSNKIWEISIEEFTRLASNKCYYCGSGPSNLLHEPRFNGDFTYNGLDRMDNLRGYTLDNVVPCCWVCNRMKSKMSLKEFLEHISKICFRRHIDIAPV